MRFAMLICGDESEWDSMDDTTAGAAMDWFAPWHAEGKLASGGALPPG